MAVDLVVLDPMSVNGWSPKQTFSTEVTTTRSGYEQRVQRWLFPKREYEIPYEVMSRGQFKALRDFHSLRGGSARGFLIWDASNFYVANETLSAVGASSTEFQLSRTVTDAGNTLTEPILHPVPTGEDIPINLQGEVVGAVSTSFDLEVGGIAQTEGVDYTVDPAAGVVTFGSAPGGAVTASFWFYVPVRFSLDEFSMDLDSLYAKARLSLIQVFGE